MSEDTATPRSASCVADLLPLWPFEGSRPVGLPKTLEILVRRSFRLSGLVSVNVNGQHIGVRPADSDLFDLAQIFGWEEYKIHPERLRVLQKMARDWRQGGIQPLIIDAGANWVIQRCISPICFPTLASWP
jgi:hypothetical protein